MTKRASMSSTLRQQVFERDGTTCQRCRKQLWANVLVDDLVETREDIQRTLRDEIAVLRWTHECWQCTKITPIVSYYLEAAYNHSIGDIESLDRMLMERYGFVKRQCSHTLERTVIANSCVHCGAHQGNHFVLEDLLAFLTGEAEGEPYVDAYLPNCLTREDLWREDTELAPKWVEQPLLAHVHHKDGDPRHNILDNLELLCPPCHKRVHAERRAEPEKPGPAS